MTKTNKPTKLTLLALCAALAVPAVASAQPRDRFDRTDRTYDRDRGAGRWSTIGEVGTHGHDAEDFIPVRSNERFESLELVAEGRGVRLDSILVQYEDGREYRADANWILRPGERVMVDIPAFAPIKMLVLEYDNPGRHWRAREDARVSVRALSADRFRDRRNDDRAGYGQRDRRTDRRTDDRRTDDRARYNDTRFEWRGGLYVRIR
ncbi:MAG TPA: hypothetical protein VM261_03330 [Kofleriaceae bacterium]|nr:hypothetical protein [Kofleriaceae bacterium]